MQSIIDQFTSVAREAETLNTAITQKESEIQARESLINETDSKINSLEKEINTRQAEITLKEIELEEAQRKKKKEIAIEKTEYHEKKRF